MEALIVMVVLFVLAGYVMNKAQEIRNTPKGEPAPRMQRARARAEARGHRGWLSAPADAVFSVFSDFFGHLKDRHDIKHADRLGKWQSRRDSKKGKVAERATKRQERRNSKKATPATPVAPPLVATPPPTPLPRPRDIPKGPATGPDTGPSQPPASGTIPATGGEPMATVNVPPSGEIPSLPILRVRNAQWDEFLGHALTAAELTKVSAAAQAKAMADGGVSAARGSACLTAHGTTGPALDLMTTAREALGQMAALSDEIAAAYTQLMQAGNKARRAFAALDEEAQGWDDKIRKGYADTGYTAPDSKFINAGR